MQALFGDKLITADVQSVRFSLTSSCLVFPLQSVGLVFIHACVLVCSVMLTLCDPMNCRLPGSSIHGISKARILEWVAISFSRGSSQPRNWTSVFCIARWILYHWVTMEALRLDFIICNSLVEQINSILVLVISYRKYQSSEYQILGTLFLRKCYRMRRKVVLSLYWYLN